MPDDPFDKAMDDMKGLSRYTSKMVNYSDHVVMRDSKWIDKSMNVCGPQEAQPTKRQAMTDARCRNALLGKGIAEPEATSEEEQRIADEMVDRFLDDMDKELDSLGD